MKLQAKLIVALVPLALVSGVGVLLLARQAIGTVLLSEVAQRAFGEVTGMAPAVSRGIRAKDEKILLPLLNAAIRETESSYAMALDTSGVVLAHTNIIEKGRTYDDPAKRCVMRSLDSSFSSMAKAI